MQALVISSLPYDPKLVTNNLGTDADSPKCILCNKKVIN